MSLFTALVGRRAQEGLPEAERLDWLRLARTERVGPITFRELLGAYGTVARALEALPDIAARGRGKKITPYDRGAAEAELARLRKGGGRLVALCEADYPAALAQCEDAPPVLCVLGDPALLNKPTIGIVGARNASLHGRKLAQGMAADLTATGWVVASGLARGIDTAAHMGALEGGTVAVVAGGIDVVYPTENKELYSKIRARGCIVAESPLGQKPFAQSFPRRNRIISGLSRGVVVVECTMRSGSLVTARLAGEQGRDVLAVPGFPGDPRASGPNHLLRQGATLVRGAADVIEALELPAVRQGLSEPTPAPFEVPPQGEEVALPPDEDLRATVEGMLSLAPVEVDALIRDLGVEARAVHGVLLELELSGQARRLPGGRVGLVSG